MRYYIINEHCSRRSISHNVFRKRAMQNKQAIKFNKHNFNRYNKVTNTSTGNVHQKNHLKENKNKSSTFKTN